MNKSYGDKFLQINMKKQTCCFWLVLFLACFITQTTAKADERVALFIKQLDKLQNFRLPLNHPDNPFHPYLEKRFEYGLDKKDQTKFINAQLKGECFKVDRLVEKGFLRLYPFLKPVFKNHEKAGELTFMLEYNYRVPFSRCSNYNSLNKFKNNHTLKDFSPLNLKVEIAQKYQRLRNGGPKKDKDELISILFGFGEIAFCKDYHLSIGDVIEMTHQPGGMVLTIDEELYLIERANHYKLYSSEKYNDLIEKLRPKFKSSKRFDQIRNASRDKKLLQIDLIKGFWHQACKEILETDKKKL